MKGAPIDPNGRGRTRLLDPTREGVPPPDSLIGVQVHPPTGGGVRLTTRTPPPHRGYSHRCGWLESEGWARSWCTRD